MAARRNSGRRVLLKRAPSQKPLYKALDHGHPVRLKQSDFAATTRSGSWGTFAESFLRFNERALQELDLSVGIVASHPEPTIQVSPGGRVGAIPLRSAQTGAVVAGFLVAPRFGWSGVGSVMSETGWAASPNFLDLPLVPGSARQIPPWVLAGPVLFRLQALLKSLARGYVEREEMRQTPRGRILWPRYISESLATGAWNRLPCRFPDLRVDPDIRSYVRWAVERIRSELLRVGTEEAVGAALIPLAIPVVPL